MLKLPATLAVWCGTQLLLLLFFSEKNLMVYVTYVFLPWVKRHEYLRISSNCVSSHDLMVPKLDRRQNRIEPTKNKKKQHCRNPEPSCCTRMEMVQCQKFRRVKYHQLTSSICVQWIPRKAQTFNNGKEQQLLTSWEKSSVASSCCRGRGRHHHHHHPATYIWHHKDSSQPVISWSIKTCQTSSLTVVSQNLPRLPQRCQSEDFSFFGLTWCLRTKKIDCQTPKNARTRKLSPKTPQDVSLKRHQKDVGKTENESC